MINNKRQKADAPQILVVDDTQANLKLMTEILSGHGYRVRAAPSGNLALKTVAVELPDLILLDVKMPDMDGYEVCRRLKSDEGSCMIPVIFISALDETADKVKAFEAGGVDYVTKPLQPAEILARVGVHLRIQELTKKLQEAKQSLEQRVEERTEELTKANKELQADITERNNLKSQLLQAQKMEFLGQLAGGIAHDFNNMLTGIKLHAYLGRHNMDSKNPVYIKLRSIEDIVDSSVSLTKQLLGFARGGKYEVRPTDLNDLIEKTANLFGMTRKEITIHRKYQKTLWAVDADQGQMEQIFMNLFVNAQHAMPDGGNIYIRTVNVVINETSVEPYSVKPGRYVEIAVADTGTGIDEKIKDRIFEPFFTTKERGIGTGLGLASVYGIVKNHGGYITVDSTAGEGSTFTILLPASDKKVAGGITVPTKLLTGSETILLVEDEKGILNITMALLEALGYKTYGAEEGRQAIETYKACRDDIALVILDLIMPDMDGEETLENLKKINPDVKVILTSGYNMNEKIRRTMQKGCKDFIPKPFDIHMLSVKIRDALDK